MAPGTARVLRGGEARAGDAGAARLRLDALDGIPVLAISQESELLAEKLIEHGSLPPKAAVDAVHIATAVTNGVDYLLTWNCTHIANAAMPHRIDAICRQSGYEPIVLCTPEELMEG